MHQDDPHENHGAAYASPVAIESVRITLDLYRSGKAGIDYLILQHISQPILAHYQIDLQVDFADEVTSHNVEDMTLLLDVLETATAFWEYCTLPSTAKPNAFKELQNSLLGPHPDKEDMVQFPILIAAVEDVCDQFAGSNPAHQTIQTSINDTEIVEEPMFAVNGTHMYGPENLEIPDAFALFARPLLENEAIYEDPDSLDDAMNKAQAYWDLAHLPPTERASNVKSIIKKFCSSTISPEQVKNEVTQMLERFHELFPERK